MVVDGGRVSYGRRATGMRPCFQSSLCAYVNQTLYAAVGCHVAAACQTPRPDRPPCRRLPAGTDASSAAASRGKARADRCTVTTTVTPPVVIGRTRSDSARLPQEGTGLDGAQQDARPGFLNLVRVFDSPRGHQMRTRVRWDADRAALPFPLPFRSGGRVRDGRSRLLMGARRRWPGHGGQAVPRRTSPWSACCGLGRGRRPGAYRPAPAEPVVASAPLSGDGPGS